MRRTSIVSSAPARRFLGVAPHDIIDFGLEDATNPLSKSDIKRAIAAIRNVCVVLLIFVLRLCRWSFPFLA